MHVEVNFGHYHRQCVTCVAEVAAHFGDLYSAPVLAGFNPGNGKTLSKSQTQPFAFPHGLVYFPFQS